MALFQECDPTGNGCLSFAEIDAVFRIKFGTGQAEKRMMLQAYDASKNYGEGATNAARDYVDWEEFRAFLEHIATRAQAQVEEQEMVQRQVDRLNAAVATHSAAAIAAAALQCAEEQQEHEQRKRRRT